jgi:uncharacterized repeat protein (TIGR03803 family)
MKHVYSRIIHVALAIVACALITFALTVAGWAQDQENILYTFADGSDGATPITGLVADSAGNFYGTTTTGGGASIYCNGGCGTVYKLSPASGGGWTETVIYRFAGPADGGFPWSVPIFDAAGNLYGETAQSGPSGWGTVFRLSPNADGSWTLTTLYSFKGGLDGTEPTGGLIFDAQGNLYGTTLTGGGQGVNFCSFFSVDGCGTVFKLTPTTLGEWKETQLHAFTGGADGALPYAGVTFDANGALYGTAATAGGSTNCQHGCGTVFRLSPHVPGGWRFSRLTLFSGRNGAIPHGRLVFDAAGNLFGTTTQGGSHNAGSVFELTPTTQGPWKQTQVYNFSGTLDGYDYWIGPEGPLLFDAAGNIFGTTPEGGSANYGAAFELSPAAGGGWTFSHLFSFPGQASALPNGGLISDAKGNLYGTTYYGGTSNSSQWGTVFQLSPTTATSGR